MGPPIHSGGKETVPEVHAQSGGALGSAADGRYDRPKAPHYNPKSAYAKTLRRDGKTWGDVPASDCKRTLAHDNSSISCQICHTSWATSCFGCHLPMKSNK